MLHATASIASLCLLVACGGGGSDAPRVEVPEGVRTVPASAGSDLNESNVDQFIGPMARMVLSMTGSPVLAEEPLAAERDSPLRRERRQAIEISTVDCEAGGRMEVQIDDADNDRKVSPGDAAIFIATNCEIVPGVEANGSFALSFNAVELNSRELPTAFDASGTFTQLRLGSVASLDGRFRLWQKAEGNSDRMRLSYMDITSTLLNETTVYNVDLYGLVGVASSTYAIDGGIGLFGQTYAVVQGDVFSVPSGQAPNIGTLRMRDAAGDTLLLRAKTGALVDFEFTPAGANAPTVTRTNRPWSEFSGP